MTAAAPGAVHSSRNMGLTEVWRLLALFALACFAMPASAQNGFRSTQPSPRVEYWQQRVITIDRELSDRATVESARLVFLGDSITDFWLLGNSPWHQDVRHGRALWDESFGPGAGPNRAINLAVSGDRTEHVLHRIKPRREGGLGQLGADGLNPEFVVLLVGINNSWMPEEPVVDSIVQGIRTVVSAVSVKLPRARIVVQTLLPTAEAERNRGIVEPVNQVIKGLAADPQYLSLLSVLDLHAVFVDRSGRQISGYFVDGLHPNEAGYRAWRDRLMQHLQQERSRSR
jgi:lysophospholipase L1-like esterase